MASLTFAEKHENFTKKSVFCIFSVQNFKICKNFFYGLEKNLMYLNAFLESFSMAFSEFQNVNYIRRYSTKTPENCKKFMKKYSFLHFFGSKTEKLEKWFDVS